MLTATSADSSRPVNAAAVNCTPWSALKTSGLPPLEASSSISMTTIADHHRTWAWWALGAGNVVTARKHAFSAFRRSPLALESWRAICCALRGY